jgi:hypothetical protein
MSDKDPSTTEDRFGRQDNVRYSRWSSAIAIAIIIVIIVVVLSATHFWR